MQAAAVGSIEAADPPPLALEPLRREPGIGAPLGAVTVQHIDAETGRELSHPAVAPPVARTELTRHRAAPDAERTAVRQSIEGPLGILGPCSGGADDAHLKSEIGLGLGQIVDVTEQTSDRRSQAMENAKSHDQ